MKNIGYVPIVDKRTYGLSDKQELIRLISLFAYFSITGSDQARMAAGNMFKR